MSAAQYLYRRRSGIYFVRLCVPLRLRRAVGKGEIHRSTGCRDFRLAKIVCHEIAAQWHDALRKLEHMDPIKIVAGSLDLLGQGCIPLRQAAAAIGADQSELAADLTLAGAQLFVEANDWDGWLLEDIEQLEHVHDEIGLVEVVLDERALQRHGHRRRMNQRLSFRFSEEALACCRSDIGSVACQFLLWPSRERAFVVPLPGRRIARSEVQVLRADVEALRERLAARVTPDMVESARVRTLSVVSGGADSKLYICAPRHSDMRLSELVSTYIKQKRAGWRPNTLHTNSDRCRALVELTKDPMLRDVERTMLLDWAERLKQVPHDRHKVRARFETPDANFMELIGLAQRHDLARITPAALEKLIDGVSEFFGWAYKQRYFTENPASGLGAEARASIEGPRAKSRRKADERELFTKTELDTIFSAEWFRDGVGPRTKRGEFYEYRPFYYWLPLLALFTGGRVNELAQLYLDDFDFSAAETPHVDFNLNGEGKLEADEVDANVDGGAAIYSSDKSLKTVASERKIPLHPTLIALGLGEYVAALRAGGHRRLFPELTYDPVKGYGKAAGRWFNDRFLGKKLGIERNGRKTFHSLRHHYATALGAADTPLAIKVQLMGHSAGPELVNQRYDKGRTIAELNTFLKMIDHGLPPIKLFRVDEALQAVAHATKLKALHRAPNSRPSPPSD